MPIYEYECEKCNAIFEAMQPVSAKPLKTCNGLGCNGKVHRLVSASGFILKGSGWYTSDYPSEARKKGWESESQQATNTTNANSKGTPTEDTKTPSTQTSASAKESIKPPKKKPTPKNPYSGSKKPKTSK